MAGALVLCMGCGVFGSSSRSYDDDDNGGGGQTTSNGGAGAGRAGRASGGAMSTGGAVSNGGSVSTGGAMSTGGAVSNGGSVSSGGAGESGATADGGSSVGAGPASGGSGGEGAMLGAGGSSEAGASGAGDATGGGAGGSSGSGACTQACADPNTIDDFEDGDVVGCDPNLTSGWWLSGDDFGIAVPTDKSDLPTAVTPARDGSCTAVRLQGSGFTDWGVLVQRIAGRSAWLRHFPPSYRKRCWRRATNSAPVRLLPP